MRKDNVKAIKITSIILLFFLLCRIAQAQHIQSGTDDSGLTLAFDSQTKKLTAYYENYTGWDDELGIPRFSCVFYMEGTVSDSVCTISTYYPGDTSDWIQGKIQIINDSTLTIHLPEDHGGCWNVQHFADEPVRFIINKHASWKQIGYVSANKAYFYGDASGNNKQKSYLLKNDFVCIDKITGGWALCTYYGKINTSGWIRTVDLNK